MAQPVCRLGRPWASDPLISFELGRRPAFGAYEVVDHLATACPTARESFQSLERYFGLITPWLRYACDGASASRSVTLQAAYSGPRLSPMDGPEPPRGSGRLRVEAQRANTGAALSSSSSRVLATCAASGSGSQRGSARRRWACASSAAKTWEGPSETYRTQPDAISSA